MDIDIRRSRRNLASPSCAQQIDENELIEDTSLEYRFEEIKNKIIPLFGILGKSATTDLERRIVETGNINTVSQKLICQAEVRIKFTISETQVSKMG
jgi:hypothetical protein